MVLYEERVPWHAYIPFPDVIFIFKICIMVEVQVSSSVHYLLAAPSYLPQEQFTERLWGLGKHTEQGEQFCVPVCSTQVLCRCGETTFGTINVILIALAWKQCYCMVMKLV